MKLYKILKINKKATSDEIKRAYRNLAKLYHPDKNAGDKESLEKFKDIANAYSVLRDDTKRALYDKIGDAYDSKSTDNPEELYQQILEKYNQDAVIEVPIEVSVRDLYHGCQKAVSYNRYSLCKKCNVYGTKDGKKHECEKCNGKGEIYLGVDTDNDVVTRKCENCKGLGIADGTELCKKCLGNCCISGTVDTIIDIPSGGYSGHIIVLKGKGHSIKKNERIKIDGKTIKRYDVNFIIVEKPYKNFTRAMDCCNSTDISYMLELTFLESLCGFRKTIKHISGEKLDIVYKNTIVTGDILVLKNKGMPIINNTNGENEYGNLLIYITVQRPDLSRGDTNKIWQLLEGTPYPPVSTMKSTKSLLIFDDYKKMTG